MLLESKDKIVDLFLDLISGINIQHITYLGMAWKSNLSVPSNNHWVIIFFNTVLDIYFNYAYFIKDNSKIN